MPHPGQAVVTGAFSYTVLYVARRLLEDGVGVRTLTRIWKGENTFGGLVPAYPLGFSDPAGLCRSMEARASLGTPTRPNSVAVGPLRRATAN